jgi:acyl-coenzyme A thioesterase PaaI-like protein
LCRIAADVAPRAMLAARDVAQLLKLQLVREEHGKLELTAIGRERHRQISGTIASGGPAEEINAGR